MVVIPSFVGAIRQAKEAALKEDLHVMRDAMCAPRWQEALQAGRAPRVVLRATHEGALSFCSLGDLKRLAVDLD